MSSKPNIYPSFRAVILSHTEQCLCCKRMLNVQDTAYETERKVELNYLCVPCHEEYIKLDGRAMYQSPRYVPQGRVLMSHRGDTTTERYR